MAIKDDLKQLQGTLKIMQDQIDTLNELADSNITEVYGLNITIKDVLNDITTERLRNMDENELIECLNKSDANSTEYTSYNNLKDDYDKYSENRQKPFVEYLRDVLLDVKKSLNDILKLKYEKLTTEKQIAEITDDYFNYLNSAEYKEKKKAHIAEMRDKLDDEPDEDKRKKMAHMLDTLDSAESCDFLFKRIDKYGTKELQSIKTSFFDNTRSAYVIQKFNDKLPRYGYDANVYQVFFNIEEKFLGEEYYDRNNLFLFFIMRYIAYADANNKDDAMLVSSILLKIYNLVYHRYETQEMENEFIEVIKKFDDYFIEFNDYFAEHNTTSPNNPERQRKDKEREAKLREIMFDSLKKEGIEPAEDTPTLELRKMMDDIMKKKQEEVEAKMKANLEAEGEIIDNESDKNSSESIESSHSDQVMENSSGIVDTFTNVADDKGIENKNSIPVEIDIDNEPNVKVVYGDGEEVDLVPSDATVKGIVEFVDQLPNTGRSAYNLDILPGDIYIVKHDCNSDEFDSNSDEEKSVKSDVLYMYDGNMWIRYSDGDVSSDIIEEESISTEETEFVEEENTSSPIDRILFIRNDDESYYRFNKDTKDYTHLSKCESVVEEHVSASDLLHLIELGIITRRTI